MRDRAPITCASDVLGAELSEIEVIGRSSIAGKLDARGTDAAKQRADLIKAVRAGEHVELIVGARTFRQKLGHPNTKFVRHRDEHLPALAASYKGQPFLLDHRSWDQQSRMGTIVDSVHSLNGGTGWHSFDQKLHIVKPHGVISALDGTLDRFSIAWHHNGGDVLCTAHGKSILAAGACGCWPGDIVDGKPVEFELQEARGTETSGVNSPAVTKGTGVKDIRAALCEELGLSDREIEIEPEKPRKDTPSMKFPRLMAALGLATLSSEADDESAAAAVANIKRERAVAQQELAETKAKLTTAETKLSAVEKERDDANELALKSQVDAELDGAYRGGKLRYERDEKGNPLPSKKEARLRRIAKEDGVEGLRAELADMDVVVPVGERVVTDKTPQPKRTAAHREAAPAERRNELADAGENQSIDEVAAQLGLDPKDMPRFNQEA